MHIDLAAYKNEVEKELAEILSYWMQNSIDEKNGGFYGRIGSDNMIVPESPKGAVLNARILWSFSAAYNQTKKEEYLHVAHRAFEYITSFFIDQKYGGVYWSVDYKGEPLDTKKQVYALAFTLYAFSEYYLATANEQVMQLSVDLFETIEKYSYDAVKGGYLDAFTKEWQEMKDLRLSTKDANEKKTMNTHLHLVEAYANFYKSRPGEKLKDRIIKLLNNFLDHIIDGNTGHLILFFDDNWNIKSDIISFGHDIEAAWLLQEAAEIINDEELIFKLKVMSVIIADAAAGGLDKDGGLFYEEENGHLIREKHWWPQAEAMVGFLNAWQLTGEDQYLDKSIGCWKFTEQKLLDKKNGEWFWGIKENGTVMIKEDKIGIWKCPYHNSRACLQIISRLNSLTAHD